MSKEQKKAQKKKEREREVHKKILDRREHLRAAHREEVELQRRNKRIDKLKRDMGKLNVWSDEVFVKMDEKTFEQIEKNSKILKALEDEYLAEQSKKQSLNKELDEEGFLTLDEKISHLNNKMAQQAREFYDKIEASSKATEEYVIKESLVFPERVKEF